MSVTLARLSLIVALLLPSPLGAQTEVVYRFEEARWDNIGAERERNEATGMETLIIDNRSDEPIVIQTVKLVECQNLRTTCGVHKVKVKVGPKDRKVVLRAYARDRTRWFTFGYSFTWIPEDHDAFLAQRDKATRVASRDTAAFSPATWDNLLVTTQPDEMGVGQIVNVENRSDETVVVTSVTLTECVNIRTLCERHPVDVVVAPKERKKLLTVRWVGGGLASSYRHSFEWRRVAGQQQDHGRQR